MNPIYLRGHVDRQALDTRQPGDPIWFTATTEGMKGDGLNLKMDRLRLERYRSNPVIGYGHRFGGRDNLPIGRSLDIDVAPPALRLNVGFDQNDDFARLVEQKVVDGYLNAMSVGFDAWGIDNQTGIPEGWELFEASIVPIPLDPDALSEVGRAGIAEMEGMLATARSILDEPSPRAHGDTTTVTIEETSAGNTIRDTATGAVILSTTTPTEPHPTTPTEPHPEPAGTPRRAIAERRMRLAGIESD